MRENLVENGLPYDFLVSKDDSEIEHMYSQLSGYELILLDSGISDLTADSVSTNSEKVGVVQRSAENLPLTDMDFDVENIGCVPPGSNVIESINVSASFRWLGHKPFVTETDAITFNWDASLFYWHENFYAEVSYPPMPYGTGKNYFTSETASVGNQGGLGIYIPIKDMGVSGSASFFLKPKAPMRIGKTHVTTINAEYAHNGDMFLGSVTIGNTYFGVSITPSGNTYHRYDSSVISFAK